MARLHELLAAALVGGVAGGTLIWFAERTAPSSTIRIELDSKPAAVSSNVAGKYQILPAQHDVLSPVNNSGITTVMVNTGSSQGNNFQEPGVHQEAGSGQFLDDPSISDRRSVTAVQTVAILNRTQGTAPGLAQLRQAPPSEPHHNSTDFALSFALQAADPYIKEGFTVREDFWGGDLPVQTTKAILHQLFKGNEYWFWMGSDQPKAKISIHVYDSAGNLAEVEAFQEEKKGGTTAGARVIPKKTESYYLIVEVEKSPDERTNWALAYGFR